MRANQSRNRMVANSAGACLAEVAIADVNRRMASSGIVLSVPPPLPGIFISC